MEFFEIFDLVILLDAGTGFLMTVSFLNITMLSKIMKYLGRGLIKGLGENNNTIRYDSKFGSGSTRL